MIPAATQTAYFHVILMLTHLEVRRSRNVWISKILLLGRRSGIEESQRFPREGERVDGRGGPSPLQGVKTNEGNGMCVASRLGGHLQEKDILVPRI